MEVLLMRDDSQQHDVEENEESGEEEADAGLPEVEPLASPREGPLPPSV